MKNEFKFLLNPRSKIDENQLERIGRLSLKHHLWDRSSSISCINWGARQVGEENSKLQEPFSDLILSFNSLFENIIF